MSKWALIVIGLTFALAGFATGQKPPSNTPKQDVAETGQGKNGDSQSKPDDSNHTSANPASPAQQPATPDCDETCQQGHQNLAIQGKLEWFTAGLVFVGFLQVTTMIWQAYLLRQTRNDVHSQANTMANQAKDARDAVESSALDTKATIEALTLQAKALDEQAKNTASQIELVRQQIKIGIDKEKARLSLTDYDLDMEDGLPIVRYLIINHGTTPAFIKSSWFLCAVLPIDDLEWPHEQHGDAILDFPEVIATVPRFVGKEFIWDTGAYKTWEETENAIKTGKLWLFFRVRITYRHIFDDVNTETLTFSKLYGLRKSGRMPAEWRDSRYGYGEIDDYDYPNPN